VLLDHISIGVTNARRSKAFYDAVLAPLGATPVMPLEINGELVGVGYGGPDGHPTFWIQLPLDRKPATHGNGTHIAFRAPSREAVDAFYLAALDQGGVEDGRPGLRTEYHPAYYAAFVLDPDGNKIEAVRHGED
jgi:catechol 2,3-dioxygenase-like lactoylglutathione lyase family enzyme